MQIVYGTKNKGKINHMKEILRDLPIEILSLNDFPHINFDSVKEDGQTPLENAKLKCDYYYEKIKLPLFSCDSGLYFPNIAKELSPGLFIRRVNGRELSDEEMIDYYSTLAKNHEGLIKAVYKNAIYFRLNDNITFEKFDGDISSMEFYICGEVVSERVEGFPLDSLSKECEGTDEKEHLNHYKKGFQKFFIKILNAKKD